MDKSLLDHCESLAQVFFAIALGVQTAQACGEGERCQALSFISDAAGAGMSELAQMVAAIRQPSEA
jgi:hypothetical protein